MIYTSTLLFRSVVDVTSSASVSACIGRRIKYPSTLFCSFHCIFEPPVSVVCSTLVPSVLPAPFSPSMTWSPPSTAKYFLVYWFRM